MIRPPLALAALMVAAAPAMADVTPREVWDDWLAALQEDEAEVSTRSVEEADGMLVVSGLAVESGRDEDRGYSLEIDEIVLAQSDDGTVGVTVSPEYPIVLSGTDDDGTPQETHLRVLHPDLEMTVADEDGTRRHVFSAPEVRIVVEEVLENGEPLDLAGEMTLSEPAGSYEVEEGVDGRSSLRAARIAFDLDGTDPDSGEAYTAAVGLEEFDSANVLQILGADTAGIARRLPEGESIDGSFSAASTSFRFESVGSDETAALSGTVGPAETSVGLSADGLTYESTGQDMALEFAGSSVPLPQVSIEIGGTRVGFEVPLLADDEPQPFAFDVSMRDVALDDGLWNMVDPAGILPRDPGAITLDLSGETEMDRDVDARSADEAGGEIRSVELNTVRIAFVDAEVDATGELTIEESPTGTPLPVGQIEVALNGATRLLERLVQAGIVPQEQATGTRMMLSMFARPGDAEGELVSTIRFAEDGSVFVNDQQVR